MSASSKDVTMAEVVEAASKSNYEVRVDLRVRSDHLARRKDYLKLLRGLAGKSQTGWKTYIVRLKVGILSTMDTRYMTLSADVLFLPMRMDLQRRYVLHVRLHTDKAMLRQLRTYNRPRSPNSYLHR